LDPALQNSELNTKTQSFSGYHNAQFGMNLAWIMLFFSPVPNPKRLAGLDVLRGIAVLLVMLGICPFFRKIASFRTS
jgi:hypothetical protein